ncbi:MAG: threonine--tRNA ligase [Candidatus Moraniibacteriota bacterium]|nr:MAG: threonine--tRNA ligase [Candidatus Moranbacteria bacterium]
MSQSPIDAIRHSLAHLLAMSVLELDPDAKLGTGPATETGFFYDFAFSQGRTVSENDFKALEKTMRKFINRKLDFTREEISESEARKLLKNQPHKLELIDEIVARNETISVYKTADFVDLCEGPHIKNTGEIPADAFALTRIAGAYWKSDESREQLTRITGIAFESKAALEKYQWQQEEAKKRDHRKLGKELKLFTISDLVGSGLPLLQPHGMIIRQEIENYLWNLHKNKGYSRVWTPHIAKETLYQTSGHAEKFGDELFRVQGKEEKFFLKPMNCPHHMQIFADNDWSYRDMPVRYFEPATVYRDEKSGQLAGLTRVRSITQDDGHLFCRASHIGEEVSVIVSIIKEFYTTFNMIDGYWVRLSVRGKDGKYLGSDEIWNTAENALEASAKENYLPYERIEGEAAFYGPKLDFMFKDALDREWQLATIQCDFNLPERFNLSFANEKGEKERPVVIHRAISGSLERFMGIMIEHCAGSFPFWLSPVQIAILPIGEAHRSYAEKLVNTLRNENFRVEIHADESLGKRIRETKIKKVPYTLVIGDQEVESDTATVESRDIGKLGTVPLKEILARLTEERERMKGN